MSARTWEASAETHRMFCFTAPEVSDILAAASVQAALHEDEYAVGDAAWPSFTFNLMYNFDSNDWYGELCVSTWDDDRPRTTPAASAA